MSILNADWIDDELRILHDSALRFTEAECNYADDTFALLAQYRQSNGVYKHAETDCTIASSNAPQRDRMFIEFHLFLYTFENAAQLSASLAIRELFVFWESFDEGQPKMYN